MGSHIAEAYSSSAGDGQGFDMSFPGFFFFFFFFFFLCGGGGFFFCFVFTFLLINPRDLLAFGAILFTRVLQLKLSEISTPKYLALVTASRTWP